jgi:ABC-type multidrug transport system ATPase subunit
MIIIHKGKKVIEGNVNELLDPSDTIVKVETTDDSTARTIISQLDFISLLPDSNSIRIKMNKKDVPAIVQEISQAGLGIISVQSRHSLEDYFISLTNPELNVEPVLY